MTRERKLGVALASGVVVIAIVIGWGGLLKPPFRSLIGITEGVAAPPLTDPLRDALSGIDYVANREHLDDLLGDEAAAELILIARDDEGEVDAGLRIRAYMALALYPTETLAPLLDAVDEHASTLFTEGVEIVLAKAAMASIAIVARSVSTAQKLQVRAQLNQALGHPVPDLRASAARALGRSGIDSARPILENKAVVETSPLVREAIRRALLDLGRF